MSSAACEKNSSTPFPLAMLFESSSVLRRATYAEFDGSVFLRSGDWSNLSFFVKSFIYDYGGRLRSV